MFKALITRLFIRVVIGKTKRLNDKDIDKYNAWMAKGYADGMFDIHYRIRDAAILGTIGTEQTQRNYLKLLGQREELHGLMGMAKLKFDKYSKLKKK